MCVDTRVGLANPHASAIAVRPRAVNTRLAKRAGQDVARGVNGILPRARIPTAPRELHAMLCRNSLLTMRLGIISCHGRESALNS